MKKDEVKLEAVYAVKVSGHIAPVRIVSVSPYGGWNARNLRTSRDVRIRGAQKLRYELEVDQERSSDIEPRWKRKTP